MTSYIVDEAWERPTPDELVSAGYSGLMGYISQDTTGKNINRYEIDAYHARGLDVGLNYEYNPGSAKNGAVSGISDGNTAVAHARALGAPAGMCLYFSVDWDVTDAEKPAVLAYANATRDKCLAAGFEGGIYAGYWVCLYLLSHGYKGRLWQAYAWSGGNWIGNAVIRQIQNGIIVGKSNVDRDQVMNPDWGQWKGNATMAEDYGIAPNPNDGRTSSTRSVDMWSNELEVKVPGYGFPSARTQRLIDMTASLARIEDAVGSKLPGITQDMLNQAVAASAEAIGKAFAAEFAKHIS